MKLNLATSFVIAALLAGNVSATRYCQCENSAHDRIFPGINQACSQLGSNWCATNCNTFGANCDYCQWKPKGDTPDNDYHRLVSWCGQQTGSDDKGSYTGTQVSCYSYNNIRKEGLLYGGCAYENNDG